MLLFAVEKKKRKSERLCPSALIEMYEGKEKGEASLFLILRRRGRKAASCFFLAGHPLRGN